MGRYFVILLCCLGFHLSGTTVYGLEGNAEIRFWQEIRDKGDPALFQQYIERYPEGAFVDLARSLQKNSRGQTAVGGNRAVDAGQRVRIAVLPFRFKNEASGMRPILISDISRIGFRYPEVFISHSYYRLDARYRAKDLGSDENTPPNTMKAEYLWKKNLPDIQNIVALGETFGVDAAVIGVFDLYNPWSDSFHYGYVHVYLVDIATGDLVLARNGSRVGHAETELYSILRDAFEQYLFGS